MEKIKYKFQKALAKGGIALFASLTSAFLICFFTIVCLRFMLMAILPKSMDMFHDFGLHMWVTFLEMTDPGNMNQDNLSQFPFKITAILAGLLGVVIFSTLIAFITTILEHNFYNLKKGRHKVLETNHTLILGWSEKVVDIIKELVSANESMKYASVVILSEHDKEKMDEAIDKNFGSNISTSIFVSSGNPSNLSELKRVNAESAKSIIILASCGETGTDEEKEKSDIQVIKSILALVAVQGKVNKLPIVTELFYPNNNEMLKFFGDNKIIALDNWRIMGKLLYQTSLTSGLITVFDEILSFSRNEIYFIEYKGSKVDFYAISYHLHEGILLGYIDSKEEIFMLPKPGTEIQPNFKLIVLAEDDSKIRFGQKNIGTAKELPYTLKYLTKSKKKVLILGWHEIGYHYINESIGHLEEGSQYDIVYHNPDNEINSKVEKITKKAQKVIINLLSVNPLVYKSLVSLDPFSYDNVVILPQNVNENSSEKIDTDTLMIMMMLKQIRNETGSSDVKTKLISQVLNSDNQDLIVQTDIDDFITSNKLITKIIAQLSEQPSLKRLYDNIFNNEESEFYLKPVGLYFSHFPLEKISFYDIMLTANKRKEICIGVRLVDHSHNPENNFGVILNPHKLQHFNLSENDFLVVLAADEL